MFAGSCYCLNSLLNQLLKTGSLVCSSSHIDKIYLNCRVAAFFSLGNFIYEKLFMGFSDWKEKKHNLSKLSTLKKLENVSH